MKSDAATVAAYLQELPADRSKALRTLRRLINRAAPQAKETMKYGLPHYDLDGPLFALASQKHYMSLYVAEHAIVQEHLPRIGKVDAGKSCIRFKCLESLVLDEIEELLRQATYKRMEQEKTPK